MTQQSQSSIKIRSYTAEDRSQVEQLAWQVQEWEEGICPFRALSQEIISEHMDNLLKAVPDGIGEFLVAVQDDKVVGYIVGVRHHDVLNTSDVFYVKDLGVDELSRGKGIGTALLRRIEEIAREKYKLSKMLIGVICGNDGAEKLYKRLGFVPYELELMKDIDV